MLYFMQFWPILGPYDPLKSPLHYQQSTLQDSYSSKILHKVALPENGFISIFSEWKCSKSAQNVIFHAILTNFGTCNPLKSPFYYQKSTLNGIYFPKSLHKLLLPENGFNSIFFKRKCSKTAQNVISHAILANFGTIWPTKKPLTLSTKYFYGLIFPQKSP